MSVVLQRSIGLPSTPPATRLLEQDLGHHSVVFVIQQMTMKYRHPFDHGVGGVEDDSHAAANRNIHSIQPRRMCQRNSVFCVGEEVDLVL